MTEMDLAEYDFVDFGASRGSCIDFALRRLGGSRGLGIDNSPDKVREMRERGYDCLQADITDLDFPENAVRFVTLSHVLEHLPDLDTVQGVIASAARLASDFLFIQGPYFDADEFLKNLGLKFFWSDWRGHPCRLTTRQLEDALRHLGLNEYEMKVRGRVRKSSHSAIHPIDSPSEQHEYIAGQHPVKPRVKFKPPLWMEIVCYVPLRPLQPWRKITRARRRCRPLKEDWRLGQAVI